MSLRERIRGYRLEASWRDDDRRDRQGEPSRGRLLKVSDFPGMAQVCLMHGTRDNDPTEVFEQARGRSCVCKRIDDAAAELRARIELADKDVEVCQEHARALRRELSTLGASQEPGEG